MRIGRSGPRRRSDREPNLIPGALRLVVERPALASFDNQEPPCEHPVNFAFVAPGAPRHGAPFRRFAPAPRTHDRSPIRLALAARHGHRGRPPGDGRRHRRPVPDIELAAARRPPSPIVQPPATGIDQYADGEAIGPADAPVVLEVYADYQCPWCGKFARETLPGLVRTYVAAGQLRIEERAIAFLGSGSDDESLDAAAAAACAAPAGKYWTFADYLVWNQSGENEGAFSRDRLAAIAERVGLEPDAFQACLDDPADRAAPSRRGRRRHSRRVSSRRRRS